MPKDLNSLPPISDPSHQWGVAEADYDGSPLFIRFNGTAKQWMGHADLPIKLGFAIPLNSPAEHGLPNPDENEALHAVEDIIIRNVEAATKAIHVLALTMGAMKEFVFYIPAGVDIKTIHKTIQQSVTTHDVQCMAVNEPEWDSFRQFSPD